MYACEKGHTEIVKMLLLHKTIQINQTNEYGKTALTYASERGDKEMFEMLEAATKANKRDEKVENKSNQRLAYRQRHACLFFKLLVFFFFFSWF